MILSVHAGRPKIKFKSAMLSLGHRYDAKNIKKQVLKIGFELLVAAKP